MKGEEERRSEAKASLACSLSLLWVVRCGYDEECVCLHSLSQTVGGKTKHSYVKIRIALGI